MKHILIFHHDGAISGSTVSLLHIIESIDKLKYKVTVVCPRNPNKTAELLKQEKCEVIDSDTSPKIFTHFSGGIKNAFSIRTFKGLYSILKDKKNIENYIQTINPDIVAINTMSLFWIGKIAKKYKKKTICFHRETYQKGMFGLRTKYIKSSLSRWFDKIAFISKNDAIETGEINGEKQIIYDRVNVDAYNHLSKQKALKKINLPKENKYILYLGGVSRLKGAKVIVEAMKYIKDDNIKLIFVSDDNPFEKIVFRDLKSNKEKIKFIFRTDIRIKLTKIYKKYDLKNKIFLLKKIKNPEVYYKACDLLVFPSTQPHQARPVYEAGITKIPVLISDFYQTKEFAENGKNAITFVPNSSLDLANKILRVFSNETNVSYLVENNYESSMQKHNVNDLYKDMEKLLYF